MSFTCCRTNSSRDNQLLLRISIEMMFKIVCLLSLALNLTSAFLPYPFLAEDLLAKYLNTLEADKSVIELKDFTAGENCHRVCKQSDRRICHFSFSMKFFEVMGG